MNSLSVSAFSFRKKEARDREAEYIHNVLKQEEKEKYERKKLDYKPSGYMTVEEYEALSTYRDKSAEEIEIPKVQKGSDMKYVPQPTYKIVRYNDPPGSPELNITKKFYQMRQYNGQGIASPDFSIMVYPVVYYYPNSASTACDLFIIKLEDDSFANWTNLSSISIDTNIEYIGNNAFAHCNNLSRVSINSSLNYLGNNAFADCEKLTSLTTSINNNSIYFAPNQSLRNFVVPLSVTSIQDEFFYGWKQLKELNIH